MGCCECERESAGLQVDCDQWRPCYCLCHKDEGALRADILDLDYDLAIREHDHQRIAHIEEVIEGFFGEELKWMSVQ